MEIAPIVEANAYEGYAYIFQIEYVDTRNQWTEDEIYDRSYITKVVFEDGQVDTYRIREVDGVLLPGSTDLDATPPQGLYRCKINSFNQLEMITVHRTAMSQSR